MRIAKRHIAIGNIFGCQIRFGHWNSTIRKARPADAAQVALLPLQAGLPARHAIEDPPSEPPRVPLHVAEVPGQLPELTVAAGHVAATCRVEAVQDLVKDRTFLPAYQTEHEVSAIAHPIMMAGRVAGCLLVSSTLPNYFLSQFRLSLVHGYANLLTLAFEPHEFYRPELIELRVMPPLDVQREHFASFRQRVLKIMMEYAATNRPLINIQAEELVWQELERILLRLPPQAGPSGLA